MSDEKREGRGETTIRLHSHGKEILLDLPDPGDHIQKIIGANRIFYEADVLDDIRRRVPPGALAIDVGAHIGNHTIFLGAVCGLDVVALEPNPHLFEVLSRNVALNGLEKKVRALPLAAGERAGRGELLVPDPGNLGMTHVCRAPVGETEIIPLDGIELPGTVSLLKIDVAGKELEVLKGAATLLRRDHPLLYIDATEDDSIHRIRDFLEPFGYWPVGRLDRSPVYIFLHAGELPEQVAGLMASLDLLGNRTKERLSGMERKIDDRLRRLEEEIAGARPERTLREIERLREALHRIERGVREEKSRADRLAERLQNRLLQMTARLEESEELRERAELERAAKERRVGELLRRAVEAERRARQLEEGAALRFGRALGDVLHHPVSGGVRLPRRLWRIGKDVLRSRRRKEGPPGAAERSAFPAGALFQDDLRSSWKGWCANQDVKMERGGRVVILQEKSTPGVRKNRIPVEPSSAYTLRVAGCFDVANRSAFARVVDEGRSAALSADQPLRGEGEIELTFRTLSETAEVSVFILVSSPSRGDTLHLRTVSIAAAVERSAPRPAGGTRVEGQPVIASMASFAAREEMLRDAVTSILPQVDRLRVFLNDYESVPAFLENEKIEVFRSQIYGDNGDAGKFFRIEELSPGYRIVCDDDILYPPDYVEKMIEKIAEYGHQAVVGVHGVLWKQPLRDCYDPDRRQVFHFAGPLHRDRTVHLLGTGTVAYHSSALSLKTDDFQFRNMADIWFALQAKLQKVPLICMERADRWLLPGTGPGAEANVFDHSTAGERTAWDSSLVQSHVVRTNGPFTIHPPRRGPGRREKLVLAVTTYNRREYLEACLDSFLKTRNPDYEWVVIVADDGSEDGTLEYLEKLRFPHELHVIRNDRRYAVGQTNTIFGLCRSIGFDLAFKVDDDIQFMHEGWDDLYRNAVKLSGRKHLCYLNHQHFVELRRRRDPGFEIPAGHIDASGSCVSHIGVEECMGALFTFTPEVLEKVGYGDEENFPIRGQWHIDFSARCCRAGFNDARRFFDARESNRYVELQNNLRSDYRCAIEWGEEYRKTKEPAELERRARVLREEGRVFVGPPRGDARRGRPGGLDGAFDKIFVLNLDRRPDRWASIREAAGRHGIEVERFPAVDGATEPHLSQWREYAAGGPARLPEGLREVRNSREYYLDYETTLARVAFVENRRGKKAIQSAGAWGYLKSVIALLEKAMEEDLERILVLDDDACFHRDIHSLFNRFIEQIPGEWKVLQLGTLQYQWDPGWIEWCGENVYRCGGSSVGSHAVGLHRSVFPLLLNQCFRFELPYDEGALHYVKRVFREASFTFFPNLIIQDTRDSDILSSTVQEREGVKKKNVYRWNLADYDIPGAALVPSRPPHPAVPVSSGGASVAAEERIGERAFDAPSSEVLDEPARTTPEQAQPGEGFRPVIGEEDEPAGGAGSAGGEAERGKPPAGEEPEKARAREAGREKPPPGEKPPGGLAEGEPEDGLTLAAAGEGARLRLLWGCGTRTGGEFLIRLTRALLDQELRPAALISVGRLDVEDQEREPDLRSFIKEGRSWEYFERFGIVSAKIEEPGLDDLLRDLVDRYPQVKVLSTIRRIEEVITSHYNIEAWGFSEERILELYRTGIDRLEEVAARSRLYVLNIDEGASFDITSMASFLGCEVTEKARRMAEAWPVVNDLRYQREKAGMSFVERKEPPGIHTLRRRHPWLDEVEERYERLWRRCSRVTPGRT